MDIGKFKENFKDRKSRCFNCNIYRHLAKNCKRPKEKRDTRKYYKFKQVEYIAKDCRTGQKMKNQNVQDIETNIEKKIRSRVLEIVLSRHSTKDPCK